MTPLQRLDAIAPGAAEVMGAADNGNGEIRLTVTSTQDMASGHYRSVFGVKGAAEANGIWPITVIDETHIDLQGSAFANAYEGGDAGSSLIQLGWVDAVAAC